MKEAFEKLKRRIEARKETVLPERNYMFGKLGVVSAEATNRTIDSVLSIVSEVEAEFGKDINVRGNGWIPCSERLPEDSGRYMTTNMYEGEKKEVFDLWYEDGKWFIDAGEDETIRIVLAWMPLPKPYIPEKGAQE